MLYAAPCRPSVSPGTQQEPASRLSPWCEGVEPSVCLCSLWPWLMRKADTASGPALTCVWACSYCLTNTGNFRALILPRASQMTRPTLHVPTPVCSVEPVDPAAPLVVSFLPESADRKDQGCCTQVSMPVCSWLLCPLSVAWSVCRSSWPCEVIRTLPLCQALGGALCILFCRHGDIVTWSSCFYVE